MVHLSARESFLRNVGQTSEAPMAIEIEKGEGVYLYSPNGEKYLDLISGIAVSALGHNHPHAVKAVIEQAKKHMHVMVYGEFIQSPQVALAKALASTLPQPLESVFMVNSGSEAVEGALKLAKRYTGRSEIICFNNCYHGSTHGALSLSSSSYFTQPFRPLMPGIRRLDFGNLNQLEQISNKTATVIIETIQGEAGVRMTNEHYFKDLRSVCDEKGALLILDEIQCGFGRTGKFWSFEHYGIKPDILCTAKGMGGGMPLGAFIASAEIMSVLSHDPVLGHITTFGGHPVSCAAALAALRFIIDEGVTDTIEEKAQHFINTMDHQAIKEKRFKGLMMALEFESPELVRKIIANAIRFGLITDWFLFCENAIRVAPPLIITKEEIDNASHLLIKSIEASI